MAANKLHSGSGIWVVQSIQYLSYDTMGTVTSDSSILEPGEFILMSSGSWNALYGYYQGAFLNYSMQGAFPLQYETDKKRFNIIKCGDPNYNFDKIYTVQKFGNKKQVWEHYTLYQDLNYPNTMATREVVTLKEKNSIK